MGKMVVLKPVVWNDKGYAWPAGITATSGYSHDHGYGHEEWNGRSDWVWGQWKIFHCEAKGRMHDYATTGELGIIMTTMKDKRFYAVGAACNVYKNSARDMAEISSELRLNDYVDRMWAVESIKRRKKDKAELEKHWLGHTHVNWRCPQTYFAWFDQPVEIIPNDLIPSDPPRQAIAKMHSSYQQIRPDQARRIVSSALQPDHGILDWLSTEDFDPVRNKAIQNAKPPKMSSRSAATATDPVVRYFKEYEIVVTPKHHQLQADFVHYLNVIGATSLQENVECVDVRFDDDRGTILTEIKPTDISNVRLAIRLAMGQLLDYRQKADGHPRVLIIVDNEPQQKDKELALTNGFGLGWRCGKGFEISWPDFPELL